ncbi:Chaperone protein YajL [Fusobacterium polymorphum]|uniref:DJ-1 family protein n=2 Tax=Fusobacterium TaxID=848 RepID=A0A323TUY0_FUSNU|nr:MULTISPECIES: DJ-1/PfpI family protein [Fusobacterium]EDK88789.1 possible intracellular protease/amidase [Fusobacterium polymorphum ATCC 10953]MCG6839093.1 DJ-1/PfpI family protein [Fusobacterium nucleatum]PCR84511.1 DJ-1 family protein [Fusobacterium nucleatum]PZA04362.1 DJ-1 family protein [Fusobacterium nucleatum]QJX49740.1 DJ-1/PfpI family protein [Fusobacterium nucleatum]
MKKIAIFLFEGAELFEIASFTDVFGWNNVVGLKEFRDIKVETISYKESIKCTWGGELRAEKIITEDNVEDFFDYDVLIIPGGFGKANFFKDKNNKIFKKLIKYFFENNKIIVAICSAVINLLESTYIRGKKVTTYLLDNKRYFNQLKNYNVIPIEEEIVEDNNLFTCSGPGNALELSFRLLEKLTSNENVNIIKDNMFLK